MRWMLLALGLALATVGSGATIFYSESITTSGSLGGTAFTGQLVTLTFTADTSGVTFFQGSDFTEYTNVPTLSTVTVAGIGSATFTDPMSLSVSAFQTFSEFSVTDTATSTDVLDTFAVTSGFAGYNMQTPLDPVNGGASYLVGTLFGTIAGPFEFTAAGGGASTVSATLPEPSSMALIAAGLFAVAGSKVLKRWYN